MAYLLDTDILSAIRRKQRDPNLENWLRSIDANKMFLSAVTIGEIERGIYQQQRVNPEFVGIESLILFARSDFCAKTSGINHQI